MSSSPTPPYIHAGGVLRPTHQRTTSRCEKVLRELLAKDADRLARRPIVSTERTGQNHESVKQWLAQTDPSVESRDALSAGSSLSHSMSLSSKPTYLSGPLLGSTDVSHAPLADNVPHSASPAVPVHHTQAASHLGRTLGHRHHQSLTGPFLAFPPPRPLTPSPLPLHGPPLDHSRPLPDHPTQQAQNMSIPTTTTRCPNVGLFGAPTQLHQPTPSPIQCAATAAILRDPSASSMDPNDMQQNRHPRLSPRIARKHSASSGNMDHSPARPILHHPRARPHAAFLTDWTTAESPDDESSPSLTPPTASSRNLSFVDSAPGIAPFERTFATPCSPSFNIKVANEVCRSIQGYVSFFEVEGLGRPPAEVEEERLELERLEKEQRAKRSWLAWLSSGVFRASSTPSGA